MRYYFDLFKCDSRNLRSLDWTRSHLPERPDIVPLDNFDVAAVREELLSRLAVPGARYPYLAEISTLTYSYKNKAWLSIHTSSNLVGHVIGHLIEVALKHNLVLSDRQNPNNLWFELNPSFSDGPARAAVRKEEIRGVLLKGGFHIFTIREIENQFREGVQHYSFVLTVGFDHQRPLVDMVRTFRERLKSALISGEGLACHSRFFMVKGPGYRLNYGLEAYKRNTNFTGYWAKGAPRVELLNRMGVEYAVWYGLRGDGPYRRRSIAARMGLSDFTEDYPNPADRFIASLKVKKLEDKIGLGLHLTSAAAGGGEFTFQKMVDDSWPWKRDKQTVSRLGMSEEGASFILPVIQDFFPDMYKRYYDTTYLPYEIWSAILKRMHYLAELIRRDTFNEELKPYIDKFILSKLCSREDQGDGSDEWTKCREDPVSFLYAKRNRVYSFYRFFIAWAEKQILNDYSGHIEVSGP